jgi:hypothetical protein
VALSYPKGNVFSGARARFSINGTIVGYATNVAGSEEIIYEPIIVLDNIQVVEFVPVGYNVAFTAGRVRLIGDAAGEHGSLRNTLQAFPKIGRNSQEHLLNILNLPDLTCQIEDPYANKIFMLLHDVRVASHNWAVAPRGVVGEDIAFVATRMMDETEAI